MINKLVCWLWGHKRREKYFSGEYAKEPWLNPVTGILQPVAINYYKDLDKCPRCGKKLTK